MEIQQNRFPQIFQRSFYAFKKKLTFRETARFNKLKNNFTHVFYTLHLNLEKKNEASNF